MTDPVFIAKVRDSATRSGYAQVYVDFFPPPQRTRLRLMDDRHPQRCYCHVDRSAGNAAKLLLRIGEEIERVSNRVNDVHPPELAKPGAVE